MPRPKNVVNAFTPKEVSKITGLSVHMLDYLTRSGYLQPSMSEPGRVRGRVRYFSYRDLVVARIIQRLCDNGVQLARLKRAITQLNEDRHWKGSSSPQRGERLRWLVTDGREVFFRGPDGFLDDLRPGGQRAFAFIISIHGVTAEVRSRIKGRKKKDFNLEPGVRLKQRAK